MEKNIIKVLKDSSELKQVIEVFLNECNPNENINLGFLCVTELKSGMLQLSIPIEEREENSDLKRVFISFIKDDGQPKPVDYLQILERNLVSSSKEMYNPNDGWEFSGGFSLQELSDKETMLQVSLTKPFIKQK